MPQIDFANPLHFFIALFAGLMLIASLLSPFKNHPNSYEEDEPWTD